MRSRGKLGGRGTGETVTNTLGLRSQLKPPPSRRSWPEGLRTFTYLLLMLLWRLSLVYGS